MKRDKKCRYGHSHRSASAYRQCFRGLGNIILLYKCICGSRHRKVRTIKICKRKSISKMMRVIQQQCCNSSFKEQEVFSIEDLQASENYQLASNNYNQSHSDEEGSHNSIEKQLSQRSEEQKICVEKFDAIINPENSSQMINQADQDIIKQQQQLKMLDAGYVPSIIRCREHQRSQIVDFIQESISTRGSSSILLILGNTGSGKTVLVKSILGELSKKYRNGLISYLNCLTLLKAQSFYSELYASINGLHLKNKKAQRLLQQLFTGKQYLNKLKYNQFRVVVLDEIDSFIDKQQQVLYCLFQWAQNIQSNLIIIGISNLINFEEKISAKVASRMGRKMIIFSPYSFQDLRTILSERLDRSLFDSQETIVLILRKIAGKSADIRYYLQIFRMLVKNLHQGQKITVSFFQLQYKIGNIQKRNYLSQSNVKRQLLQAIQKLKLIGQRTTIFNIRKRFGLFKFDSHQLDFFVQELSEEGLIKVKQVYQHGVKTSLIQFAIPEFQIEQFCQ